MNISDWPLGRIMQLPDEAFGSRFVVSCFGRGVIPTGAYVLSDIALPEVFVLWEFYLSVPLKADVSHGVRVAMSDFLPTTAAQFTNLQALIPGMGLPGPDPKYIPLNIYQAVELKNIRQPIRAVGRRLCLWVPPAFESDWVSCIIVVSSIPKEIPD